MIVDFHCHAGRGDLLTAPWNTTAPLADYLRRARRAGINRTVVFPAFHTNYAAANRELKRIVDRAAGRLIGFAMVNARTDAGRIREMVYEAVTRLGFRGLKIHGHEAMPTREVCDAAREFRLPIIVDVAGKAEVIDMFAPQYPGVNFVIAHLGSFADDWRAHERVVEQLVKYPNVFADSSDVSSTKYGGAGMSLALSLKFAHLIGGDIAVAARADGRRAFTLTIPTDQPFKADMAVAA